MGELYYDLSDQTQITVGVRYNDDVVKDSVFSCLSFTSCTNYPLSQKLTNEYGFFPTQVIEADDAVGYKLAIKHDIDNDRMVYASYTTAVKAGGNNPNELGLPDPYDQEETAVFEIGANPVQLACSTVTIFCSSYLRLVGFVKLPPPGLRVLDLSRWCCC